MHLLKPYHDRLARFARAMTRSNEEAEDLLSDTLLSAYEHFEQLRNEQAFLSWLFSIASRLHKRNQWRRRLFERLSERFSFSDEDYEPRAVEIPDTQQIAPDTFVDVQVLYKAMNRLSQEQREALVMFEIAGLSLVEIQEIQGGSLSSVKMRLVRARERLRILLGERTDTQSSRKQTQNIAQDNSQDSAQNNTHNKNQRTATLIPLTPAASTTELGAEHIRPQSR